MTSTYRESSAGGAPSVTVVLCTRDRAGLLAEALAHLSAAASDADILVVDSGSTTSQTRDAAESAGVKYVRSDVPGLSIARNLGLEHARGEYVVYTDDDCAVDPGFLIPLLAPFTAPDVGATTGRLVDASQHPGTPTAEPTRVLTRVTSGLDAGHGALMAFRVSTLRELGGFDPVLGAGRRFGGAEDMDVLCRMLRAGHSVARVPASIVTHVYTRDDGDYERLNENYGLGIGAMCGKWLRDASADGRRLTALVLRRATVRYARRFGRPRTRRGQAAYLRGFFRGLREGRALPIRAGLFVDTAPPPPVALPIASLPTEALPTDAAIDPAAITDPSSAEVTR